MPEMWTGKIIAQLHVNGITQRQLAEEMGLTEQYVSMLLNSVVKPAASAEERMNAAISAILAKRKGKGEQNS